MIERTIAENPDHTLAESIGDLPLDVRDMKLDLNPTQKVRMVALMLGIRYYTDTIIKDADYLKLMLEREKEAKFSNDPADKLLWHLRPANVIACVQCAQVFEDFLLGKPSPVASVKLGSGEELQPGVGRGAQSEIEQEHSTNEQGTI